MRLSPGEFNVSANREIGGRPGRLRGVLNLRLLASAAVTAALLWVVLSYHKPGELLEFLYGVQTSGVIAYAGISLIALFLRAKRYQLALASSKESDSSDLTQQRTLSTAEAVIVTAIRNALVDFLPARLGELSFFLVLRRYGVSMVRALAAFGICFALDIIALLALVVLLFGIHGGQLLGRFTGGSSWQLMLVCLALLALLALALRHLDALISSAARLVTPAASAAQGDRRGLRLRLAELLAKLSRCVSETRTSGYYPQMIALSLLLRAAKYGGLYVLLMAVVSQWGITFGALPPVFTTTAFVLAEASASLPISGLMGFGAYEGALSAVFKLSQVPVPNSMAAALLVHLISQVFAYSIAAVALLYFALSNRGH